MYSPFFVSAAEQAKENYYLFALPLAMGCMMVAFFIMIH